MKNNKKNEIFLEEKSKKIVLTKKFVCIMKDNCL